MKRKLYTIFLGILIIGVSIVANAQHPIELNNYNQKNIQYHKSNKIKINLDPYSTIYEGDIVDCNISILNPKYIYWKINDEASHTTFYGDDPIIFDPEPTPYDTKYVNLTVYAENESINCSDSVIVQIKRIFFGDIHWHCNLCDGRFSLDKMYRNSIKDNYLDFVAYSGHAEWIDGIRKSYLNFNKLIKCNYNLKVLLRNIFQNKILHLNEWEIIKQKANEYYQEGKFTTLLGFEWTACNYPNFHINFYYKDVYNDAREYSSSDVVNPLFSKSTVNEIFKTMAKELEKGHLNVGFPHHPQHVKIDWKYFLNNVNTENLNKILRGVEIFSTWGNSIGQNYTPDLPYNWPYYFKNHKYSNNSWVENALWEISETQNKDQVFSFIAGSDMHRQARPTCAFSEGLDLSGPFVPSGIMAAYATHNNREEIWDAMNNGSIYASQLLKIRCNVRFSDFNVDNAKLSCGKWINCTSPLKIRVTAQSTSINSYHDRSGKNMVPYSYSNYELDYNISDIWLIKNNNLKGKPWCKVVNHSKPNSETAVVFFEDHNVQPNDFYYIAIRQKGQLLTPKIIDILSITYPRIFRKWNDNFTGNRDEYMAYIGPVFIDNVLR